MIKACVVGWPIEHSRSPIIHRHWLKTYGVDGDYIKQAVEPEKAGGFFKALPNSSFAGCNVTVPLKEIAFAVADRKEPSALAVGAANTLWVEGGKVCAANTDTYGFMKHLELSAPRWRDGEGPVLILGAGGAARAIIHGFLEAGCERVELLNRTPERANVLAELFGPRVTPVSWADRNAKAHSAGVIVNTTTLGMKSDSETGIRFEPSQRAKVVCDIVYVPLKTVLLKDAEAAGHIVVDGLGMLLHQAAPGFEKWFGVRPEVTAELRALVLADIGER